MSRSSVHNSGRRPGGRAELGRGRASETRAEWAARIDTRPLHPVGDSPPGGGRRRPGPSRRAGARSSPAPAALQGPAKPTPADAASRIERFKAAAPGTSGAVFLRRAAA